MSKLQELITNVTGFKSDKGSSLGYGTFTIAGLFNVRYSIMRNRKTNDRFVSLPSIKIQSQGETKWINQIDFPKDGVAGVTKKELQDQLSEIVLAEFDKKQSGAGTNNQANANTQSNFQTNSDQGGQGGGGDSWENYDYKG